jgi:DNA gyrase subunit A
VPLFEKILCINGLGDILAVESGYEEGCRWGGKGVSNIKVTPKNGKAVTFCQVSDDDEIFLTTNNGRMIRIPVAGIRETGRVAQGLRLIDIGEGERIVDVAVA